MASAAGLMLNIQSALQEASVGEVTQALEQLSKADLAKLSAVLECASTGLREEGFSPSSFANAGKEEQTLVPLKFRFLVEGYDFTRPTCIVYRMVGAERYSGEFELIRSALDFDYHGCYTIARQELQDSLVKDAIAEGLKHECPWVIFTAGAMGAGKGHVMKWMSQMGHFPLPDIVHVDPDAFRSSLPEWQGYVAENASTAGRMTHRESGYIVEIAQEAAMQLGKNTWVDGSLRDADWYSHVFTALRSKWPLYKIAIIHIEAAWETVKQRAASRAIKTGRVVPEEDLRDSFEKVPQSVKALESKVDFVAHITNDDEPVPTLTRTLVRNAALTPASDTFDNPAWIEVRRRFADSYVLKLLDEKPEYRQKVVDLI